MITENYDKWLEYYRQLCHFYNMNMDDFYYNAEIEFITEIVKNKLYFASTYGETTKLLKTTSETLYFTTDEELLYVNYYYDFGPLNLSCLYKFCCQLNTYLCNPSIKRIVYYSSGDQNKRANAAYLIGSFAILYLSITPRRIHKILTTAGGAFRNFVDASQGLSKYTIRLLDCFHAIEKAKTFNFFNFDDFNVLEYDTYDKIQNGDMNWLVPKKFLAFIGPTEWEFMNGHPPEFYIKYFLRNDVKTVIRLNNKVYNATVFTDAGIEHHDLFFADGTTPPKHILMRFLDICENSPAAIGVHCKAGLGRTGSLVGAYIIKHYRMSARETIAWMRICRPGSVIGQQQIWLEKIESWLWKQGSQYRIQHFGDGDKIPHHRYGIYSKKWPIERKRLILEAQKSLENPGKDIRFKTCSHRLSTPPMKHSVPSKTKRPVSERRRSYPDREMNFQKMTKLIIEEPLDSNDENENTEESVKDIEQLYSFHINNTDVRRKLKDVGNTETNSIKQIRGKIDTEKTQGDRLNEIKIKRQSNLQTKSTTTSKLGLKKEGSWNIPEKHTTRRDNSIYDKRNSSPMYYIPNMQDTSTTTRQNKKRLEINHLRLVNNITN